MNPLTKLVVACLAIMPLLTGSARAMTMEAFARMNNDDEASYVTLLVEASSHMLKAQGQPDQAAKVISFFKTPGKFGGTQQLAAQLVALNALNKRNDTTSRNAAPDYQVEDAMALTLKDDGILVPAKYLLDAGKDFQPSGPPRRHDLGQ